MEFIRRAPNHSTVELPLLIAPMSKLTVTGHKYYYHEVFSSDHRSVFFNYTVCAQQEGIGKTRFVAGLSGPELLHAGVTYRVSNASQVGLNAGLGPLSGTVWTAISLEHRLYIGKNSEKTNQKTWFFRQGATFYPQANSSQHFTLNLTGGKDIVFKNGRNGLTIDAGIFYLPESESSSIILVRSLNLWPALRFEFYF